MVRVVLLCFFSMHMGHVSASCLDCLRKKTRRPSESKAFVMAHRSSGIVVDPLPRVLHVGATQLAVSAQPDAPAGTGDPQKQSLLPSEIPIEHEQEPVAPLMSPTRVGIPTPSQQHSSMTSLSPEYSNLSLHSTPEQTGLFSWFNRSKKLIQPPVVVTSIEALKKKQQEFKEDSTEYMVANGALRIHEQEKEPLEKEIVRLAGLVDKIPELKPKIAQLKEKIAQLGRIHFEFDAQGKLSRIGYFERGQLNIVPVDRDTSESAKVFHDARAGIARAQLASRNESERHMAMLAFTNNLMRRGMHAVGKSQEAEALVRPATPTPKLEDDHKIDGKENKERDHAETQTDAVGSTKPQNSGKSNRATSFYARFIGRNYSKDTISLAEGIEREDSRIEMPERKQTQDDKKPLVKRRSSHEEMARSESIPDPLSLDGDAEPDEVDADE